MACGGGLVSLSAGGAGKNRKYGGPQEAMSKEDYASALEEQIASRKLQNCVEYADAIMPLWTDEHRTTAKRTMGTLGTRQGGPVAAPCKEDYASALRAQIAARDAQRLADVSTREPEVAGLEGVMALGINKPQVESRQRRHGAPTLPSKESYAMELREQMEQRSAKQATERSASTDIASGDEDALDAILNGKGRRHNGPMVLPPKAGYAAELREQIVNDSVKRAADRDQMFSIASEGLDGVFAGQADKSRGKRPAAKIDQVSRSSLGLALQRQMGEKASLRAGNAFYIQTDADQPPAADANAEGLHGGRKRGPCPSTSKKDYAQALQDQIARRSEEHAENGGEVFHTAFIGGAAKHFERGRRHADQMPAFSKTELRSDLQRQMAEREAQRNARRALPPEHTGLLGTEGCSTALDQQLPARMATGTHGDSLERLLSEHAVGQVC
jgi:hypothetical protein